MLGLDRSGSQGSVSTVQRHRTDCCACQAIYRGLICKYILEAGGTPYLMIVVGSMREVEASNAHAGLEQLGENLHAAALGTKRAHHLRIRVSKQRLLVTPAILAKAALHSKLAVCSYATHFGLADVGSCRAGQHPVKP